MANYDALWRGMVWRIMAENVGIVADFVDEYPLYVPLPAAHFLIAFLSALCVLCGKKSLPRFLSDYDASWCGGKWRFLSDYVGLWRAVNIMASIFRPYGNGRKDGYRTF